MKRFLAQCAIFLAVPVVGFSIYVVAVDPPSDAEMAKVHARQAIQARADAIQAAKDAQVEAENKLNARHEAWRQHVKDAYYDRMAAQARNSYDTKLSDLIGGFETRERVLALEAAADAEEQAHPDAWKTYKD